MTTKQEHWSKRVVEYHEHLDASCNQILGTSAMRFKVSKTVVDLGALVLAGVAMSQGLEPWRAVIFAAFIISGPEALELWLVNQDMVTDDSEDE